MKGSTKYIGVDVGDKYSEVCCTDETGKIVERTRVKTTREGVRSYFGDCSPRVVAIEVGTHSPWISQELEHLGHDVVVANPSRVKLITSSDKKSDRTDAEFLARLVRVDRSLLWPVKHRGEEEARSLLTVRMRAALVRSRTLLINVVRQSVKSHGHRLAECSAEAFAEHARKSLPKELRSEMEAVLVTIDVQTKQIRKSDKRIGKLEERYPETQMLRQVDGVGPVTALTFRLVVQSPERFKDSRAVGSYLGLRPRKDQSGDSDKQLRITKAGDMYLRSLLVGCAQYILGRHGPDCDLRRWGLKLAERGGKSAKKRAIVAVARKLSVLLLALWRSEQKYERIRGSEAPPIAA